MYAARPRNEKERHHDRMAMPALWKLLRPWRHEVLGMSGIHRDECGSQPPVSRLRQESLRWKHNRLSTEGALEDEAHGGAGRA